MENNPPEIISILLNNSPQDDFCGLTSNEMNRLLYEPFSDNSPLHFQKTISHNTLDAIPFFRLTEELLKIIQKEKSIKLTATGALQKKTVFELYEHRFITEDLIESKISKLNREIDSLAIIIMRLNLELSGIIKKFKGKFNLTKKGVQLLHQDKRQELFKVILSTYTQKFNWAYNDRYPEDRIGQLGWAFTIYLLHKFGDESQKLQFYSDKYFTAFPMLLEDAQKITNKIYVKNWFIHCYCARTFKRFLEWFGFVSVTPKQDMFYGGSSVLNTSIIRDVFYFD